MGSRLMRFGNAIGAGTLGAGIATLPATFRLENVGVCSPVGAWALLIATTVLPMTVLVVLVRRARGGFFALGRPGEDRVALVALLGWASSTFATLVLLGAFLRAQTHHRALAGVTFAITSVVLTFGIALVWARLAAILLSGHRASRRATIAVVVLGLVVALASVQHYVIRVPSVLLLTSQRVKVVDGLAFAMGALFASGRPFVNRRALALLGPPLAAIAAVLGVSSLLACSSLREALHGQAPAVAWMVAFIESN
jgi:hypothetical protein